MPSTGLDAEVCYSVKANSNLGVLATLARLGAGMDVVSEGELRRVLAAGVQPEKIAFSGVGKTADEMAFALEEGIFAFNVESEPELRTLSETASALGLSAHRAPRQSRCRRQHPSQDRHRQGREQIRHSVRRGACALSPCRRAPGVDPRGVHMHIGSQITDLAPFRNAFALLKELVEKLRANSFAIDFVNLGGGLGVPYRSDEPAPPLPAEYGKLVRRLSAVSAASFCSSRGG